MRLMLKQRCLFVRTATAALVVLAAACVAPKTAHAVQIFIDSAFVHRVNSSCIVLNSSGGVPRFRCPPYPSTVSCATPLPGVCNGPPGGNNGTGVPSITPCEDPTATPCAALNDVTGGWGNISNDPHIQFDRLADAEACQTAFGTVGVGVSPFARGAMYSNYCNSRVFLCGSVGYGATDTTSDTAIDELSFEIFKFQDGSNPLDEGSTPPLRTFFVDAPGVLQGGCTSEDTTAPCEGPLGPFCVLWDGEVNIQGEFGKTNGQYGFRVKTKTNQTGASGNIQITAVRAYPSGATRDADSATCGASGCVATQKPVELDVVNVHVIRSSPSLVGTVTPVPVQPYNIFYRLSKDATMFIQITDTNATTVRTVLPGIARIGEGTPNGTLTNGDSWNGRADNGDFLLPGSYLLYLQARAADQFGNDLSESTTRQISLDPLQITDIRVQPLLEGATSLAVLDYVLTEPATTYIEIYPPGTQFCFLAPNLNGGVADTTAPAPEGKQLGATVGDACPPAGTLQPVKRIIEQKNSRQRVISFWDGRDESGQLVPDGDYVFVIYAALPSRNGLAFRGNPDDRRIWTSQAKSGFIPVIRGFVGISQITPASSVVGSSPAVAGLNPFLFRYSLSRDALVNLRIFNENGTQVVKTLLTNQIRQGLFAHVERWDEPIGDNGLWLSSGTYMVQLTATDPSFTAKVTTTTALFSVNPFRITDVSVVPLLNGASDLVLVSYQLTQPMTVGLHIYPPGTTILQSSATWPPCLTTNPGGSCTQVQTPAGTNAVPVVSIRGLRAGRLRITEQWDGRDANGLLVPDGSYVFTLVAESTTNPRYFAVDRVVGSIAVQRGAIIFPTFQVLPDVPQLFNSSSTITLHPFTIQYSLTRQSSVTIQVLTSNIPPAIVRNIASGAVRQNGILLQDVWDGRDEAGNFPPPGFYIVRAVASDIASQLSSGSTAQVTISYDPLRIYDVAVAALRADTPSASIFYQVSEPMKTAVKIYRSGTTFDGQGNPSPPESISLVKRIVGVKPARTLLEDVWDGTDLRLSLVPDGTYKFKIVGSTDMRAIDDITGNVVNPAALSLDRPIDEIPVVRNASLDPIGDFERNTFAYPNPASGPTTTFQVFVPFQGKVKMKVVNVAGEVVLDKDFGEKPASFQTDPLTFVWNKTNQAGRSVARGLYYVIVRVEESLGGRNILQTVKKVVIP